MKLQTLTACLFAATLTGTAHAERVEIDFEAYQHGELLSDLEDGVSLSVRNTGGGPDLGVAFDTTRRRTRDRDLEGPNGRNGRWDRGNIDSREVLGNVLIIQENSVGIGDGIADLPDDEGSRPAGTITFSFDGPIDNFGFDLIDVEGRCETGRGFFLGLYSQSQLVANVSFEWLARRHASDALLQQIYDDQVANEGKVVFGDNSANRISAISARNFGLQGFDQIVLGLGGSGAIDNLVYDKLPVVPTPAAVGPGLLLLVGLIGRRRRSA